MHSRILLMLEPAAFAEVMKDVAVNHPIIACSSNDSGFLKRRVLSTIVIAQVWTPYIYYIYLIFNIIHKFIIVTKVLQYLT